MNPSEMRELVCTDQVRKGAKLGLVVGTKGVLRIHWDGDDEPVTYSYDEVSDLRSVKIERKAFRAERDGLIRGFHTRVFGEE
jgi:hypothetical protein